MTALARLLCSLYAPRRWQVVGVLLIATLTVAAGVALLGVSGWFLTGASLAASLLAFNLFVPSALIRAFAMIRIGSRYTERLVGHGLTLRLLSDLRSRVFGAIVQLTPAQLARLRAGDLANRITGDVDALDSVFLLVAVPVATALTAALVVCAVLGIWLPAAALGVGLCVVIAVIAVPLALAAGSRRPGAQVQESTVQLRDTVLESVLGHADLLALDAGAVAAAQFDRAAGQSAGARIRQADLGAAGQLGLQLAASAGVLIVLAGGLNALAAGTISGPLLAGLVLAVIGLFEIAAPVMRGAARIGTAAAAAVRVRALMETQPSMRDPADPQALPADGEIVLEDIRYAYPADPADLADLADPAGPADPAHPVESAGSVDLPDRAEAADRVDPAVAARVTAIGLVAARGRSAPVLDGLNLRIRPGERVAIVGASGAGKSTLLHLMLRLADPDAGRVTFGGKDLRGAAQSEVHRRYALLTQHAPVFLGTVRTNLLIGRPDADDEALWHALDAARLGEQARSLAHGLDTWVGESGWTPSAGQARRLCLARALVCRAPVIVLDEPTAGLDADVEAAFLSDLAAATRGRTVVLATHARLPAAAVDRVLTLKDGRLHAVADSAIQV